MVDTASSLEYFSEAALRVLKAQLEFDQVAQLISESGQVPAARVGG
jgi:hypothetical protein